MSQVTAIYQSTGLRETSQGVQPVTAIDSSDSEQCTYLSDGLRHVVVQSYQIFSQNVVSTAIYYNNNICGMEYCPTYSIT